MGGVEVDVPGEVLPLDGEPVQVQFDTAVADVAHVGPVAAGRIGRRNLDLEQHVGGHAVEVVDATGQAAVEQFEIKARVVVRIGFPGDVLGTALAARIRRFAAGIHDGPGIHIHVGADVVITLGTDGSLELEEIDPVAVEPGLLGEDPGAACGPEVAPAVVPGETGGGVAAVRP